jgi:hypothetical protein
MGFSKHEIILTQEKLPCKIMVHKIISKCILKIGICSSNAHEIYKIKSKKGSNKKGV